jgi:hypothetical protein
MPKHLLLAAALSIFAAEPALAENCVAGWVDGSGAPQTAAMAIDWSSRQLDRSDLPQGASGIACPRASIVPEPADLRILTELGVSFGVVDPTGRSLWIWTRAGRLQIHVEHGELAGGERAAVDAWTVAAQGRFDAALARR